MSDQRKLSVDCRPGCAACCIAPSISSSIPGMPEGKPAGIRCIQLSEDNRCKIFESSLRPLVCSSLMPSQEMCGTDYQAAMDYLNVLERETVCEVSQLKEIK